MEQPASVDPGDFLSWFPIGLATIWEIQPEDSYFLRQSQGANDHGANIYFIAKIPIFRDISNL